MSMAPLGFFFGDYPWWIGLFAVVGAAALMPLGVLGAHKAVQYLSRGQLGTGASPSVDVQPPPPVEPTRVVKAGRDVRASGDIVLGDKITGEPPRKRPVITLVEDASLADTPTDGHMWRVRVHSDGGADDVRGICVPKHGELYRIPWQPGGQQQEWDWLAPGTPLVLDIARVTRMASVFWASGRDGENERESQAAPSRALDLFSVRAGTFEHQKDDPWPVEGTLQIEDHAGTLWSGRLVLDYNKSGEPMATLSAPDTSEDQPSPEPEASP